MVASIINGNVVPVYPTYADLPISAPGGSLAVTYDTNTVYEFSSVTHLWEAVSGGGGGSGTVTSVGLSAPDIFDVTGSPVTTAGTLGLDLVVQPANTVFAGPVSGSPDIPAFRALTADDLPSVPSYTVNEFVLSPTDISNGFVTLSSAPANPTLTILTVIGGPMQQYTTDFSVSGDVLSWSGLFLDGVLISGDNLIVQFY